MAGVTAEKINDESVWEGFLESHPEANFLHSWYWGGFHERMGHAVERYGFYRNGTLVGVTQGVVEPARRGRHLVIAGGPIINWADKPVITVWRETGTAIAKEHSCIFVRVRPQLLNTVETQGLFHKLGLRRAPMHVTADLTRQLDLAKTDNELKKAMRKGTRYELNRAAKLGIEVERAIDDRFLKEFCELQLKTAERQGFVPFTTKFLSEQFNTLAEVDKVVMYRSTHEGQLLAMAFIIFYGQEAAYHYGASTELARKLPGAYAIQWEAIQEARRRGCSRYNFWGVAEHGQTNHRFYGVSVFKSGFGGEDVSYLPAHDLVVDKLRYPATFAFETARRKFRKL